MENIPFGIFASTISALPITFVGASTRGQVTSTSLNLPSGLQQGDLVILVSAGDSNQPALPAGYTQGQTGFTNSVNYRWGYKFMGPTPDTQITGLLTSSTSAITNSYCVFRNVNPTFGWSGTPSTGTSGMPNAPAVDVAPGEVVVALGFLDDSNIASSITAPTGYTLATAANASVIGITVMSAYKQIVATGTEDPGAFGGGNETWVATTIKLSPSA